MRLRAAPEGASGKGGASLNARQDHQEYIEKIRPYCAELYKRAYLITLNAEIAEYVVQSVIAEAYGLFTGWQGRISFREGIFELTRETALHELMLAKDAGNLEQDEEGAYGGLLFAGEESAYDPTVQTIEARLRREKPETQRMVMLKYGCGLRLKQIAQATDMRIQDVRARTKMCIARIEHAMKKGQRRLSAQAIEGHVQRLAQQILKTRPIQTPEMTAVFQLFSENLSRQKPSGGFGRRIALGAFTLVGAVLSMGLLWLIAVLLQPR